MIVDDIDADNVPVYRDGGARTIDSSLGSAAHLMASLVPDEFDDLVW